MTTDNQTNASDPSRPKVSSFKPSSFQQSSWEVVAEGPTAPTFKEEQFESLTTNPIVEDPMFERYDTLESSSQPDAGRESGVDETDQEQAALAAAAQNAEQERQLLEAQIQEARAAGVEEGRAAAQRESDEKQKMLEERYSSIIQDMNAQISEGLEGVERRALEFAVQIVRKVMGAIVEFNPEYILEVIKEAVKLTGGATIKTIRVSPQDLEFVKMLSPERQFKEFDGTWSFSGDDTIRSGCVIETSAGEVEYDLDKAWERIKESVVKVR